MIGDRAGEVYRRPLDVPLCRVWRGTLEGAPGVHETSDSFSTANASTGCNPAVACSANGQRSAVHHDASVRTKQPEPTKARSVAVRRTLAEIGSRVHPVTAVFAEYFLCVHLARLKAAGLAMSFKLIEAAQAPLRSVNAPPRRRRP
jgi:hypothetical protein